MRLNPGNRSFVALLAIALVPYLIVGLIGCALLSALAYLAARDGMAAVAADPALWPGLAFLAVVTAGTIWTLWSLRGQLRATERLARDVGRHRLPIEDRTLTEAAETAALAGRIDLVEDQAAYAFTYGITRPRVAVSTGLVAMSTGAELEAVLAHEHYHVRNLDPAKVVLARALTAAYFFLPALRLLRTNYLLGRELAADRRALRNHGRRPLATALYKVMAAPGDAPVTPATAAIGGSEFLQSRIEQLETGETPALPRLSARTTWATGAGLVALVGAVTITIVALGGPLEMREVMSEHMAERSDTLRLAGAVACGGMWGGTLLAIWRYLIRR